MILPKNHLLILVITLYLLAPSKAIVYDICSGKADPQAIKPITIGTFATSITQKTCRERFKVDYTTIVEPYLIFEVKFSNLKQNPTFTPYLLEKNDPFSEEISVYSRTQILSPNTGLFSNGNFDDRNGILLNNLSLPLNIRLSKSQRLPLYYPRKEKSC